MNEQPPRKIPASGSESLGQRLRALRRQAGVTESFVSQVERGVANPSVATLRRIAAALGESMASLFVGAEATGMIVRAGERKRLGHPSGEEYLLTPRSAKALEIIYAIAGPGQGSGHEPYTHEADEECVIILSGQLDIGINGEMHHLDTGDALLLDPKLPHSYHNPGTEPATSLWVMSPPGY